MTMSSAFVRNSRTDVDAGTPWPEHCTRRCSTAPPSTSTAAPNIARYVFLDLDAHDFFVDRAVSGNATAALLRAEAAREPRDRALRELIGELPTPQPGAH